MKNITLGYILLLATFITSCQNIGIKKQLEVTYQSGINFFNNKLINHFPVELPDSSGFSTNVIDQDTLELIGFDANRTVLWKAYSLSEYKAIASGFRDLSSTTYSANDSNLLLIFSYCDVMEIDGDIYRDQETPERQALVKHNVTMANSLPVPLFEIDEYKGNTMSGLPKNFKLYVLDAKPGKYIDEKHLQECDCLPEKWKHGYSKGVALSDEKQVVIYWIIVW